MKKISVKGTTAETLRPPNKLYGKPAKFGVKNSNPNNTLGGYPRDQKATKNQ